MGRYKKVALTLLTILLSTSLFVKSSLALIPLDPNIFKIKLWIVVCNEVKEDMETKIEDFEDRKEDHIKTYTKLEDRLSEKINKWKDIGYDVEQIEEDLSTLKDKVDEFKDDYDTFLDKLTLAKDEVCSSDETTHDDAMQDVKLALKEVRLDSTDIRSFYQTEIRPHILDLKDQELGE